MAKIDTRTIEQKIIDDLDGPGETREPREYLGYSGLGSNCARKVWYSFRWVHFRHTSGRMQRLFSRGDQEEVVLKKEFDRLGIEIIDDQYEVIGFEEHVKGHIDGKIIETPWFDEPVLCEFKTYNDKRFNTLCKLGVEKADFVYYAQAQSYMGHMKLNKTLFIATNKNNDQRHVEIIEFNQDIFDMLEEKSEGLVTTDFPPDKIGSGQSTWFECRFCDYKEVCHHNGEVNKNCRTCKYGTILICGDWKCGVGGRLLNKEDQLAGCELWEKLESL